MMRSFPRAGNLFLVVLVAPLWTCASAPSPRAPEAPQPSTSTDATAPADWSVPPEEAARINPLTASSANVKKAKRLFSRHCTACHGTLGRGDGPVAQQWARLPKDLTNPERQARLTDGEIFWKISKGHRTGSDVIMPGLANKLGEQDRWLIVIHVRSLSAAAPH